MVVLTQAIAAAIRSWGGHLPFVLPSRLKGCNVLYIGKIGEGVSAGYATDILEEHELLAMIAMKDFHELNRGGLPQDSRVMNQGETC
jgi:hypothetical protein